MEWFAWGIYRGVAAVEFARYLNVIASLTDEPIRVIAHSHGCNVVKLASSLPSLSPKVTIEQARFLACPHFYEDKYTQEDLSWRDRLDIAKVTKANKVSGHRFRYKLAPQRFGKILNVYCEKDKVQVDIAKSLSGGQVPLTGNFLENILAQLTGGTHEAAKATRREMDKDAAYLYEDLEVQVEHGCSGIQTHSVMHGSLVGRLAGIWLNSHLSIQDMLEEYGDLPALPCDDSGE